MGMMRLLRSNARFLVACIALFGSIATPRIASAASSDNVAGWAWNAETGWISVNSENCVALNRATPGSCDLGGRMYGLTIFDRGELTGYAWSERAGWICVGATCATLSSEWGSEVPSGGWRAIVRAATGEVRGWAKVLGFRDRGWISLSCENTGTCSASAYRTTVDLASGRFTGYAWNGAATGSALGWIAWRPAFGGVTTTWRPERLCTRTERTTCSADAECNRPGELCCLAGQPCGQCDGTGAACGEHTTCSAGVLCCRPGAPCGRCVGSGLACGSDAQCSGAAGSCCPPGAVCTGGLTTPTAGDPQTPAEDPIGRCVQGDRLCVIDRHCGSGGRCDATLGVVTTIGASRGESCTGGASCATVGRCAVSTELCATTSNCAGGGPCEPVRSCAVGSSNRCTASATTECAKGACVDPAAGGVSPIGRCTNTAKGCSMDAECGESGRCDATPGRCTMTRTSCVSDAECRETSERCVGLGACERSSVPCVDGGDCASDERCLRSIGLCAENNAAGNAIVCRSDAMCSQAIRSGVTCERRIGKCTQSEQLCATNAHCPLLAGGVTHDTCGKLFLPWVQTKYGAVYSGRDVGSTRTPPPPVGQVNATYCILARGRIVNFLSAPERANCGLRGYASKFTFPQQRNAYGGPIVRIDVKGILAGRYGPTVPFTPPFPTELAGKVYLVDNQNLVINVDTTFTKGAGLFVIRGGDLVINGNLRYGNGAVARTKDLASPGFLVLKRNDDSGGNIRIASHVQELVGAYYAEGDVSTGSRGATDVPLRIRGVMVARRFLFERLAGSATIGAEEIIADGRVLANTPPGFGDLTKALPTMDVTVP